MARLASWLSADVMHALGWALIHSLWQCLGLAALAAVLMAFSRRPSIRYLVATGTLVAMLAAPITTVLVLMKPAAPVHALLPASPGPRFFSVPAEVNPSGAISMTPGAAAKAMHNGAAIALEDSPRHIFPSGFLSSDFLSPKILPWLVEAWLCGVALFSLRFAGGFLLLEHKRRGQSNLPSPRILAICLELQRQLGLNRAIRYLECGWLQAPAVIGWFRPIVLLPLLALTGLSEAQLRAVIAHELAHIRRLDAFVNLLQILVETLLFYHPAIWWLNRRIRTERELCCDEIAVSLTGNRLEYAKALTLMAEWEKAPALAMAANRGPLSQRIFHVLGKKPFGAGRRMLGLTGSILFLAAALGAANALFGITYPIPVAHAKASLKAALTSNEIAADHRTRRLLGTNEPAAKDADQVGGNDATGREDTAAPGQTVAAAIGPAEKLLVRGQAEKLVVPSPDLSRLLPAQTPLTPVLVASNDPPAQPASNMSPAALARAATRPKAPICALPSVADSVDLKDVPGSDLRTAPVTINGKPKQFLLDIGTAPTEVSQAAVTDLALPEADSDPMFANGRYFQSVALFDVKAARNPDDGRARVNISSFTIGNATAQNLKLLVANNSEIGKSKPYDGLMTGSFFKQDDAELDFAQNKLNYLTPTSCTDPDQVAYWPHAAAAIIPMTNWDGKIQVEVLIQGQAIPAVIDTSSPRTVMRRDIAELMLGLKADTPDMVPDGDVRDGAGLQVYRHTFTQISFAGGVTAYNVPALIQTNSMIHIVGRQPILGSRAQFIADPRQRIPGLTLGMDVLHQLHLYVASAQQKLYVTSAE